MFLLTKHSFFQVVTGGHYDVDVLLMDPKKNVIYKQVKKQYDSYTWTAAMYELITCFHEFRIYEFQTYEFQIYDFFHNL